MELILKGEVTKLESTFGVIKSHDYDEEHFFLKSDILEKDRHKIKVGNKVVFELKSNKIKGSSAIRIKCLNQNFEYLNVKNAIPSNNELTFLDFNETPYVSTNAFVKFITSDFKILPNDNKELNDVIKVIVQDNKITQIEKDFLLEKTNELNLSEDLFLHAKDYMFSNNPFFDNILNLIFKDGLVKENELAFLKEKARENSFSNSFTNNRFWQYAFYNHKDVLLKNDDIKKIIKIWYISQNNIYNIEMSKDWILLQLNIVSNNNLNAIIRRARINLENKISSIFKPHSSFSNYNINNLYDNIFLSDNEINNKDLKFRSNNELIINNQYKKSDIYSFFNVPVQQQGGKWNNGYCEHNGDWFIFANIDMLGHGFNADFNYNNSFDKYGDFNWEAIKDSNLKWDSIKKIKSSNPYIFVRSPETKKNSWEYIGLGSCIYAMGSSPVKFKWKIVKDKSQVTRSNKPNNLDVIETNNFNSKNNVSSEKLNSLAQRQFKELYKENPFYAFSEFNKFVKAKLKIKSKSIIKDIWNNEIIAND